MSRARKNSHILEIEIDEEPTDVIVYFDDSPAEPDVNWAGGLDLESIFLYANGKEKGDCLMGIMSSTEIESVHQNISDTLNDLNDPDNDPRY
jgi:predicted AlkP superfamily phosphohydrolase/phosphomutase